MSGPHKPTLNQSTLRSVTEFPKHVTSETHTHCESQAGLNLNLFGAISGVFSGRSRKVTDTAKDGSSKTTEHSEGEGAFKGAGHGTMNAIAAGQAETKERHLKAESERVTASKEQKRVDHLGLGGLIEDSK